MPEKPWIDQIWHLLRKLQRCRRRRRDLELENAYLRERLERAVWLYRQAKSQEKPPPSDEWAEVEAEVAAVVADWQTPMAAVRRTGVTPDYVRRVLEHYRAAGGAYGPGALHRRLMNTHPAVGPGEGWPPSNAVSPCN